MSLVTTGLRQGPFVIFRDDEDLRQAVRLGAVMALSDADTCQDATIMQLPGGRVVLIRAGFDEVLRWFI
jgi:hypothetical protein